MPVIDVIKYEGDNDFLVWKYPYEDFNTSARLIVQDTQEAYVYRNGERVGPFTGQFELKTENYPFLRKVTELLTGGVSPNHYTVYFVNKAYSLSVPWGTSVTWTVQDPSLQVPFEVQAHGRFVVQVCDSAMLLNKLVGSTKGFSVLDLQDYFSGLMVSTIKSYISDYITRRNLLFSEIGAHISTISESVKKKIAVHFANYGLSLKEFVIEHIGIQKDEVYEDIRVAMKDRAANTIRGVTEQEKMEHEVNLERSKHPGDFAQVPRIGFAASHAFEPASSQSNTQHRDQFSMGTTHHRPPAQEEIQCPHCGATISADSKFCSQCGKPVAMKEVEMVSCPSCGTTNPKGSNFCKNCGQPLK